MAGNSECVCVFISRNLQTLSPHHPFKNIPYSVLRKVSGLYLLYLLYLCTSAIILAPTVVYAEWYPGFPFLVLGRFRAPGLAWRCFQSVVTLCTCLHQYPLNVQRLHSYVDNYLILFVVLL